MQYIEGSSDGSFGIISFIVCLFQSKSLYRSRALKSRKKKVSLYLINIKPSKTKIFRTYSGPTGDGCSMSVFLLYGQISQGRMADFPAFIASKAFDL